MVGSENKLGAIVSELSKLTVMEAAELSKMLEEHWGVSAAVPVAMAAGGASAAVEEKTEFDVFLIGPGEKKIDVIKEVRTITGLGLKEAKDFTEASASAPQQLKTGVNKEEAEKVKKQLEAVGAKVEIK